MHSRICALMSVETGIECWCLEIHINVILSFFFLKTSRQKFYMSYLTEKRMFFNEHFFHSTGA